MDRRIGVITLAVIACALLIGGVVAYQKQSSEQPATVDVHAPFAHVEKDANGIRVQAPGVDIEVPKKSTE
jgi:ABC-type transporter Mla subunit MlaD